jgi:hypothetical protein
MAFGQSARAMSEKHMDVIRREGPLAVWPSGARHANPYAHKN